ncbi:hypothetical protein BKA69DRAFT_592450 [Paraphysoderma sedebokerense]|nr:hypothetical protein BKA69DRAFT_592450 [Paraphysoderma sedebokerense]
MKLTLAIPIGLAIYLFIFRVIAITYRFIVFHCRKRAIQQVQLRNIDPPAQRSPFLVAVRIFNALLSILFANLATKSLGLFDCTLEQDGYYYLDADASMRCYSDQWNAAVPYGLAGIIVYVIGIPLYYSALLYVIYQKSYQGTFWRQAKEVVPKIMTFEHIYKPEKQRFILVQLLQKFCLIVVSMFFSSRTGLQIVLTQAILLVCLLLYFRFKPYKYTVLNILEVASIICR